MAESGGQAFDDLRPPEHARERHPGRDRLGDGDQVRFDVVVLDGEEPPRAGDARLHLVDDEDDAVPVADLPQPAHVVPRTDEEAAFALDGLDHDRRHLLGGHLRVEGALERVERRCARPGLR